MARGQESCEWDLVRMQAAGEEVGVGLPDGKGIRGWWEGKPCLPMARTFGFVQVLGIH